MDKKLANYTSNLVFNLGILMCKLKTRCNLFYHQIEKSEEKPVRNEAESEKEGEDFSKRKKVNQERDKVTYIKEKEENYKMITAMKKW